ETPGWPKTRCLVSLLGRELFAAGDVSEITDANANPAGAQPDGRIALQNGFVGEIVQGGRCSHRDHGVVRKRVKLPEDVGDELGRLGGWHERSPSVLMGAAYKTWVAELTPPILQIYGDEISSAFERSRCSPYVVR